MSPPYRAVIFDMDGVLLDSEPLHLRALNSVLGQSGLSLPEEENERLLGLTMESTWDYLVRRFALTRGVGDYIEAYDEAVLSILSGPLAPSPGAALLLGQLQRHGIPLALASSSKRSWIVATLESLGFTGYFPTTVSGEDVTHGKPAPDIFLRTAELLSMPAPACLVIEDSPNGIAAARRAGMDVIAVRTHSTRHLSLSEATTVVDSLADIDAAPLVRSTTEMP